jgi:hypothetical protein
LNEGIRASSAPRFGYLLSDDWLEPSAVEQALRIDADIVSTSATMYYADGTTALDGNPGARTMADFVNRPDLERKAAYLSHFFLFRKNVVIEAGGLDERIGDTPGIDDYDLPWVLLERGASVGIVESRLYNYRDHHRPRLTLGKRDEMLATLNRIFDKHGVNGERRQFLVEAHSRWFGRPVHEVLAELQSAS